MATAKKLHCCYASDINIIVKRLDIMHIYHETEHYNIFKDNEITSLSNRVVEQYTIKDCENIIITHGDFIDALIKSKDVELDVSNKLASSRKLALPYIKIWITNKVNQKLSLLNIKKNSHEHNCSICFDSFYRGANMTITPCMHVFHTSCLRRWNKHTCPMCRGHI